jgi:hypothetical protein
MARKSFVHNGPRCRAARIAFACRFNRGASAAATERLTVAWLEFLKLSNVN